MQPRIFLLLSLSFQTVFSQFQNQMLSSMGSTSETSSGIIATQTIGQASVIGFYKNSIHKYYEYRDLVHIYCDLDGKKEAPHLDNLIDLENNNN